MSSGIPHKLSLVPYAPDSAGAVRSFEVHVARSETGLLSLRYVLDADTSRLRIPSKRDPHRTDELWKHTCFEAFVRAAAGSPAYQELNFSPSTEWAAYSFDTYRQGMAAANVPIAPDILVDRAAQRLEMTVRMELGTASRSPELALAAVLEDENGRLSYWALKHSAAKPDFHHPDSFTLKL